MQTKVEMLIDTQNEWDEGLHDQTAASSEGVLELKYKEPGPDPSSVNAGDYCSFSASSPGDDWIEAVYIENQNNDVLLDYYKGSAATGGYEDNTDTIIMTEPGDTLTISVTVNAGGTSWTQSLSWGHSIDGSGLVMVADLNSADGCPWTHTYQWTVPDELGNYLVSWWEHYNGYDSPCGDYSYAERIDFTLHIETEETGYPGQGTWLSPLLSTDIIKEVDFSLVEWDENVTAGVTDVTVETSLDEGTTWFQVVNGDPVPGIGSGDDLTGKNILVKINPETSDNEITPGVEYIKVTIVGVINIQLDTPSLFGQTIAPEAEIEEPSNIYPYLPRIHLDVNPPEVTGDFVPGTITGTVKKRDISVSEAKVIIINNSTEEVEIIVYTDENGEYRAEVPRHDTYHVLVEYQDDDGYWQAESIPFVEPEI